MILQLRNIDSMRVFLSKTIFNNGCVEWIGSRGSAGYGKFRYKRAKMLAHRVAYSWANSEEIPNGMFVCHSCDNPSCVNPEHLWLGTIQDNNADSIRKGRAAIHPGHTLNTGSRNGRAKLSENDIPTIKSLLSSGTVTQTVIAKKYGVPQSVISDIKRGVLWK